MSICLKRTELNPIPEPCSIVVALFSWVVLHVPTNAMILIIINKVFYNMSKPV
jgi:hypothetical protein